jgi:hypothetical protein
MEVTRRSRRIAWGTVAALLASSVVLNYPLTTARSASRSAAGPATAHIVERAQERPADALGPLSITPALDTGRAVSVVITAGGGTLTATAANGAIFMLTIPAGAIPDQETITMTPVASIPDLPFSGGLAGAGAVQLEPEGLLLLKAATLVIQPSSPLSVDQQCPFSWHQAGDDFHLFPLTLDVTTITMQLTHFSGYGTGSGTSGDRGAAASHSPGRSTSQLEQQIQKLPQDARDKLSLNPTKKQTKKAVKTYNQDLLNLLLSTFANLLSTLQQALLSDSESAMRCALSSLLDSLVLLHSKDLDLTILGVSDQFVPTVTATLQRLISKSSSRCPSNLSEIGNLLGLAKFGFVLAGADAALSGLSKTAQSAVDAALKCGSLKMSFDSTVTIGTAETQVTLDITLKANVALTPTIDKDGVSVKFTGQGPLNHDPEPPQMSVIYCSVSGQGTNSTLKVISFEFDLKLREVDCTSGDAETPPTTFKAVIDVGRPVEDYMVHCPNGIAGVANGEIWRGQFFCRHQNQAVNGSGSQFTITDWTPGGSPFKEGTLCGSYDVKGTACPLAESAIIEVTRNQ